MKNQYFHFSIGEGGIAELVFNEEKEKINILSSQMMSEFKELLDEISANRSIKALVLKSGKKDIFVAGADIHEIAGIQSELEAEEKSRSGQDIMERFEKLPFPTVFVIDGACLGGGLELALSGTYRIVTDNKKAQLGLPEVTLGIIPGFGGTYRLPRLIGLTNALPIILTGKSVDGPKALKIKLADALYPSGFLDEKVHEFVKRILTPEGRKRVLKKRKNKKLIERFLNGNPLGKALVFSQSAKDLKRKAAFYPAPAVALSVIRKTTSKSLKSAMNTERKAFGKIAVSPIARNLIQIFFTNEALKKEFVPQPAAKGIAEVQNLAILGAGKMGGGIAWAASSADIPVRMKDVNWEAVGKGYAAVQEIYQSLVKIRKWSGREALMKFQKITGAIDYSGFEGADFILEAIVEDLSVKTKVLRELEEHVRPDAIIATNTSSLSVNEMAKSLKHPKRFIGFHFFNPVSRMPLIEVVPGVKTSSDTIARVVAFARSLKKTPIVVNDCHGFLVNRILMAYLNESLLMLEEGADLSKIDRTLRAFGMPMGPFELLDEIGIPVGFKVAKILSEAYPERSVMGKLFHIIGESDQLKGKASGQGFYLYHGKDKIVNPFITKMVKGKQSGDSGEIQNRILLRMINEAAFCLEENIIGRPEYLDMAMILGTGFPAFRGGILRYADQFGIESSVELLLKYEEKYGPRFKPADSLKALSSGKGRFYL